MLRIVAGKYRGRKLVGPQGTWLRPTGDRVRESIYNVLQGLLPGARVADLYAGTGALGLEALSRGAARVVLVEVSRQAEALIARNLARLGEPPEVEVVRADALTYLRGALPGQFDLILADPPYAAAVEEALMQEWPRLAPRHFVLQHRRAWRLVAIPAGYAHARQQRFGATVVEYFERQEERDERIAPARRPVPGDV